MVRISLTADDLARTHFRPTPAPLVETYMCLAELRRTAPLRANGVQAVPPRSRWVFEARRSFPSTALPLLDLISPAGTGPMFLDPVTSDLDEGLEMVLATPRSVLRDDLSHSWYHQQRATPPSWLRSLADRDKEALAILVRALRDLYTACVAPRWDAVLAGAQEDVLVRGRTLAVGGYEKVFGTLHSELAWRDGALERRGGTEHFRLAGEGLTLVPTAFWNGRPLINIQPPHLGGNALVYAAQRPITAANGAAGPDALTALLGATRAAVLRTLRQPCSTEQLAARLGISPSSASLHAKILREADLIQTSRNGRSVRHTLTPLARELLTSGVEDG